MIKATASGLVFYQKHFILWIAAAKRSETKDRRVREAIALLEQGRKLGIK